MLILFPCIQLISYTTFLSTNTSIYMYKTKHDRKEEGNIVCLASKYVICLVNISVHHMEFASIGHATE